MNTKTLKENKILEYILACRRGDNNALKEFYVILYSKGLSIYSKYYVILIDKGYSESKLKSLYNMFIFEFINIVEYTMRDFFAFYRGYLNYKFIDEYKKTLTQEYSLNHNAKSLSEPLSKDTEGIVYEDVVSDIDNVNDWYESREMLDYYLNSSNELLTSLEKNIIGLYCAGYSFVNITNKVNLSYKQVLTIYNSGIIKIKKNIRKYRLESYQNQTIR